MFGRAQQPGLSGLEVGSLGWPVRAPGASYDESLATQRQMFQYGKEAPAEQPAPASAAAGAVGQGDSPAPARWATEDEMVTPAVFVRRQVRELAERPRKPIVLGEEQKGFLALVAQQVEHVLEQRKAPEATGAVPGPVRQGMYLLLGRGVQARQRSRRFVRTCFGSSSLAVCRWRPQIRRPV